MRKLLILVALLALLAIPALPVAAQNTLLNGTVAEATLTISAPSNIAFGTFVPGNNDRTSTTAGSVAVIPNSQSPTGWTVDAKDANQSTNSGYMLNNSTPLASKLLLSKDGLSTTAPADSGINYTGGTFPGSLPFAVRQNIGSDASGTYYITISFTGAPTF